jgi:hypothetical protein
VSPNFKAVEVAARRAVAYIEGQVSKAEAELAHLRNQHSVLSSLLGGGGRVQRTRGRVVGVSTRSAFGTAGTLRKVAARKGPAVDWNKVLSQLPKRFGPADVAKLTPELSVNNQARVIALARWVRSNEIRKLAPGQYQRV